MTYRWDWTDARVETLLTLKKEGLSAAEICERLGAPSRNAVIGKVNRLGLAGKPRKAAPKKKKPPTGHKLIAHRIRERKKSKPLPPPEPYTGPSVSILEIGEYQCRKIVAGTGAETMFCGAPIHEKARFKFCPHCSVGLFNKEAA